MSLTTTEQYVQETPIGGHELAMRPEAVVHLPGDVAEAMVVCRALQEVVEDHRLLSKTADAEQIETLLERVVRCRVAGSMAGTLAIEKPAVVVMDQLAGGVEEIISVPAKVVTEEDDAEPISMDELFGDDDDLEPIDRDALFDASHTPDATLLAAQEREQEVLDRQKSRQVLLKENDDAKDEPLLTTDEAKVVIAAIKDSLAVAEDRSARLALKEALHDLRIETALGRLRLVASHSLRLAEKLPKGPRHKVALGIAMLMAAARTV